MNLPLNQTFKMGFKKRKKKFKKKKLQPGLKGSPRAGFKIMFIQSHSLLLYKWQICHQLQTEQIQSCNQGCSGLEVPKDRAEKEGCDRGHPTWPSPLWQGLAPMLLDDIQAILKALSLKKTSTRGTGALRHLHRNVLVNPSSSRPAPCICTRAWAASLGTSF